MSDVDLSQELNRFRERLLDLSNRNPLLNYRKSARRTLQIVDELPNQIFERLVPEQKEFYFYAARELDSVDGQAELKFERLPLELPEEGPEREKRHQDDRLQTNLSQKRLDSFLKGFHSLAHGAIEETGVNYAHVAIGMLAWNERDGVEKKNEAPLILVPIHIERFFDAKRGQYSYVVKWSEEEIKSNLSLIRRMERDFGFKIPDFEIEQSPDEYFESIRSVVGVKGEWTIKREALIGFFSFHKLLMYLDIDPANWNNGDGLHEEAIIHDIVAGQEVGANEALYARDYNIDDEPSAASIALVSDADSSQHSALCDIAAGKNLVIEGPPGTGKSQTITNAIGAAIHAGKSVLFVAEKLAALKVVQKRLSGVGLGDFCLELHSEAATARRVFESLKSRLEGSHRTPRQIQTTREMLSAKKRQISDYLKATSHRVGPYDEPLYDLFWRTIQLRKKGIVALPNSEVKSDLPRIEFEERKQALGVFHDAMMETSDPKRRPWWGFFPIVLDPNDLSPIDNQLTKLQLAGQRLQSTLAVLTEAFEHTNSFWLNHCDELHSKRIGEVSQLTTAAAALVPRMRDAANRDAGRQLSKLVRMARQLHQYCDKVLLVNVPDAIPHLAPMREAIDTLTMISKETTFARVRQFGVWLSSVIDLLRQMKSRGADLEGHGHGPIRNIQEFERAEYLFKLLRHPAVSDQTVLNQQLFLTAGADALRKARSLASTLREQQQELEAAFHFGSLPDASEIIEIAKALRPHASSWFRFFSGEYRAGKKKLSRFWRPGIGKSPVSWVDGLERLSSHLEQRSKFGSNQKFSRCFGSSFRGEDTNWDELQTLLNWVTTIKNRGLDYGKASRLLDLRDSVPTELRGSALSSLRKATELELKGKLRERLGLNELDLPTASLDRLLDRAATLLTAIETIEAGASCFAVSDVTSMSQLNKFAELVDKYVAVTRNVNKRSYWESRLGDIYNGESSDVDSLDEANAWVQNVSAMSIPQELFEAVCLGASPYNACKLLGDSVGQLADLKVAWWNARSKFGEFGSLSSSWFVLDESVEDDPGCLRVIERLRENLDQLPAWIAFSRTLTQCDELGLSELVTAVLDEKLDLEKLVDSYELTVLKKVADEQIANSSELRSFSRQKLENAREQFQELDREMVELNRQDIASVAAKRVGVTGVSRGKVAELTEMGLIRHEVQKQRRHVKIRDLLRRAGKSVQELKPCFMMSPLSIAQYLAPESIKFDLVIMDEASQIKPEDALGTILRAKQLVVVGDPKQMPPTSFFDRNDEETDDDVATQFDNTESILEVAMKSFQPVRRLKWHYRSEHESLIEFSNSRFYDNDLMIFPSAISNEGKLGVRHHYVENAVYHAGANPAEADVIADAIIAHAKYDPSISLGVGAFNGKQAALIQELLDRKCEADALAREAIGRLDDQQEDLFVKSLENLQGDERDVIFISYTYGPSPEGRVFKYFGPMTKEVGWRRLNVLVTRARKRIEVFSSMTPSEIGGGPNKSRGVNAMRDYLEFCISGTLPDRILDSGREPDSPFEVSVAETVAKMGLAVIPQVGVAGFFIDIGVLRPGSNDEFILGIECDGASYHSSRSARDRDRLREDVIRRRGWDLYRIWSTDWFYNQKYEEERLTERLSEILNADRSPIR